MEWRVTREIRASRKKLDEAQENVVEDLTWLAAFYSKARDRSGVEKTSREPEPNSVRSKIVYKNIWIPIRINYRVKRWDFPGNYEIYIPKN